MPLQGVLSKLGAAKELMKEVLAREAKKQQERAAAKEGDVYVSRLLERSAHVPTCLLFARADPLHIGFLLSY